WSATCAPGGSLSMRTIRMSGPFGMAAEGETGTATSTVRTTVVAVGGADPGARRESTTAAAVPPMTEAITAITMGRHDEAGGGSGAAAAGAGAAWALDCGPDCTPDCGPDCGPEMGGAAAWSVGPEGPEGNSFGPLPLAVWGATIGERSVPLIEGS